MNKLTAEHASELAEAVKLFVSQPLNFPLSRGQIMEVARIALPILEQQERGEGELIEWKGGDCPVAYNSLVIIRYFDGEERETIAAQVSWNHCGDGDDIIAYRIIPEQPTNHNGEQ